jgi:hypothetical protein
MMMVYIKYAEIWTLLKSFTRKSRRNDDEGVQQLPSYSSRRKQKVGQKHFSLPETANFYHHKSKDFFFQVTHVQRREKRVMDKNSFQATYYWEGYTD